MLYPLVPVVLSFALGIGAARYLFFSASQLVLWISFVFGGAALLLRLQRYSYGLFAALMGFFLCGAFLAKAEHSFLPSDHIESLALRGLIDTEAESQIDGWAHTPSVKRPGGEYFDLALKSIRQSGPGLRTEGLVRLYYFAPRNGPAYLDIPYGTRLSISVRNLRRPRNFLTAGFYDSEGNMARQGIYFTGIVRNAEDAERLPGREGGRWRTVLYGLRGRFLASIDRFFPPENDASGTGAILKAMLLGDSNWLRPENAAPFQETGTYHLLVVSGLHAGALVFGLVVLLSRLRMPQWLVTLVIFVCLCGFTFMAGTRIPVVRATIMISLYLVARLVYRERLLLNVIAAAALFLLIANPSDLMDSGFQLSFLAVSIIGAVVVPLADWTVARSRHALNDLDDREMDMRIEPRQVQLRHDIRVLADYFFGPPVLNTPRAKIERTTFLKALSGLFWFAEAALLAAFLQTGLALSMAVYFNRVVWSGVAANLLAVPLATILIPFGYSVLLVSLFWPGAAALGARGLGAMVSLLRMLVDSSAHFPRLDRRVPMPPNLLIIAFVAALLLIALFAARRSQWVWLPVAGLAVAGVLLTLAPYPLKFPWGRLEVTAIDVGQGDSLFVTFPQGRTMLVDGGGAIPIPGSPPPRLDVGERVVAPYLWSRRFKSVDVILLTHSHSDHLGGLIKVLRDFRVGELWIGPGPSNPELAELMAVAAEYRVPVRTRSSGERSEIDGVSLEVLSPPADWHPNRVSNNDSVVMRLGYGSRHIFLSGDAENRMEKLMVAGEMPMASDVLKVGHHGSKTSTTAAFLSRVAPSFAMISVGAFSRFGHPNREVIDALAEAHVQTYRTDFDGSITMSTDGNRIDFSLFRDTLGDWPPFPVVNSSRYSDWY